MENGKKTAIILLNWNAYKDTYECLKSLEQLQGNFSVFLVDNDSQDDSYFKLLEDDKVGEFQLPITFIQSGGNLGFAGGNNVGIARAYIEGFDYFWMLNNDTVADPLALEALRQEMDKDESIGIVGSKILYYRSDRIWFAGGKVNKWTGSTHHIGYCEEDCGQHNQVKEVDFITGCSLFFRRELIDDIGMMSEDYFLYYEETDWNIRARKKGWKVVYAPESVIYHKVSMSSGGEGNFSPYVDYYYIRNPYYMAKRAMDFQAKSIAFLVLVYNTVKKGLKVILRKQDRKKVRFRYIYQGFLDACRMNMGKHPQF